MPPLNFPFPAIEGQVYLGEATLYVMADGRWKLVATSYEGPPPTPPTVIGDIPDVDVVEGAIVTRNASEAFEGVGIEYSMTLNGGALSGGWAIDASTGEIAVPTSTAYSTVTLVVTADNKVPPAATETFTARVTVATAAPEVVGDIADVNVTQGTPVTRDASVAFSGVGIEYTMLVDGAAPPAGYSIDIDTGAIVVPTDEPIAASTAVVTADNGTPPSASVAFDIVVTATVSPPETVGVIPNVNVLEDTVVTRTANGVFLGVGLSYSMTLNGGALSGGWAIDSVTGDITVPTADPYASVTLVVTASNGVLPNATASFTSVVTARVTPPAPGVKATGGTVTDITVSGQPYKLHTFTADGDFVVTEGGDIDYLVIGGGGPGGGATKGGGGGAGAFKKLLAQACAIGTFPVVVGAGGAAPVNTVGSPGTASTFKGTTAAGGGRGGAGLGAQGGGAGASGGGAGATSSNTNVTTGGTASDGFAGGNGQNHTTASNRGGGGGGGAASAGASVAATGGVGGVGGNGVQDNFTGTLLGYCGGGGGGGNVDSAGGSYGGGAAGANGSAGSTPGSGGGGADTATTGVGGAGANGIVYVRYPVTAAGSPPAKIAEIADVVAQLNEPVTRTAFGAFSGAGITYSMTVDGVAAPTLGFSINATNGDIVIPTAAAHAAKTLVVTAANGNAPNATESFTVEVQAGMTLSDPILSATTGAGNAPGDVLTISGAVRTGGVAPVTRWSQYLRGAAIALDWTAGGAGDTYTVVNADRGFTITAKRRVVDSSTPPQTIEKLAVGSFFIANDPAPDATVSTLPDLLTAMQAAADSGTGFRSIYITANAVLTGSIGVNVRKTGTRCKIYTDPVQPARIRNTVNGQASFAMNTLEGFDFVGLMFENLRKDGVNAGNSTSPTSLYGGNAGYPAADAQAINCANLLNCGFYANEFKGHHRAVSLQAAHDCEWAYNRWRQVGMDGLVHFKGSTNIHVHHNLWDEFDIDPNRATSDAPNRHSDCLSFQTGNCDGIDVHDNGFDSTGYTGYVQLIFFSNKDGTNATQNKNIHVYNNIGVSRHANQWFFSGVGNVTLEDNRFYVLDPQGATVWASNPRLQLKFAWFGTNVIRDNTYPGVNDEHTGAAITFTGNTTNTALTRWANIPNKPLMGPANYPGYGALAA